MSRRPEARLLAGGRAIELLRLPAWLYGKVTDLRAGLYDRGWRRVTRLDVPVVSVGNLTAGGTGKTPFVHLIVRELQARGWRPGVLSRGYRAPREEAEASANDESRMLERLLPGVPRVEDPDRVAGGRELVREGADVIVLDDGFQHRRLARDLDLVLVDATRPWGLPAAAPDEPPLRALLPRGLLRERPEHARRAHALVLTRCDQVPAATLGELRRELESLAPGLPLLEALHRPTLLRTCGEGGASAHPSSLRGREVDLVSGLGNPEAFAATVEGLGAHVHEHRMFPDHHAYRAEDLGGLGDEGRWIVTSAKDAVKLEGLGREVRVLEVELVLRRGSAVLQALLDALPPGRARRERAALHEGLHG